MAMIKLNIKLSKNYSFRYWNDNETDVSLAKASSNFGWFQRQANRETKKLAEEQKVEIKYFNII